MEDREDRNRETAEEREEANVTEKKTGIEEAETPVTDESPVAPEENPAEETGVEEESSAETGEEAEAGSAPQEDTRKNDWYVLRVQSGREDTVARALEKRVQDFDHKDSIYTILVPKETVSEIKGKKKRVVDRKLYPGYIFVEMDLNDDVYHFLKETPGIGDFVGSQKKPMPMTETEVDKMLSEQKKSEEKDPAVKINFAVGDSVKITSGPFENFDGFVEEVNAQKGVVIVSVTIFGRSTPVELEYWQVERI